MGPKREHRPQTHQDAEPRPNQHSAQRSHDDAPHHGGWAQAVSPPNGDYSIQVKSATMFQK